MNNGDRFSIFDVMERKKVFSVNPANQGAQALDGTPIYKGPVEYPKMLYHPEGEEKVLVPEVVEIDRGREIRIPAKYEMISMQVNSPEEEKAFRAEGWHIHPAKAVEAANRRRVAEGRKPLPVPKMSLDKVNADLVESNSTLADENAQLKAELEQLRKRK